MKTAKVLLAYGFDRFGDLLKAGVLSNGLRDVALSPMRREVLRNSLNRVEAIVKSAEVSFGAMRNTSGAFRLLLPGWSKQDRARYRDFCRWAFAPPPAMNGLVSFGDCALVSFFGVRRNPLANLRNCYNRSRRVWRTSRWSLLLLDPIFFRHNDGRGHGDHGARLSN